MGNKGLFKYYISHQGGGEGVSQMLILAYGGGSQSNAYCLQEDDINWTEMSFLWFYNDISIFKLLKIVIIILEKLYNLFGIVHSSIT